MLPQLLLIDDNPADCDLLVTAVEEGAAGITVGCEEDAQKALETILQTPRSELPKVILLDLNMPTLNGLDVLKRLHEAHVLKRVDVIMFSTSARRSDIEEAKRLGAADYIVKPKAFRELVEVARHLATRIAG